MTVREIENNSKLTYGKISSVNESKKAEFLSWQEEGLSNSNYEEDEWDSGTIKRKHGHLSLVEGIIQNYSGEVRSTEPSSLISSISTLKDDLNDKRYTSLPVPMGLPSKIAKSKPSYLMFPKYRRQYKIESIYVNDLYTLTYDEGETLESLPLKSVEVNYRRADREEIRRKLAMGNDEDYRNDRQAKKPSLQSRLQNGKNLQICFMNETASDCESQCSDTESTQDRIDDTEAHLKNGKNEELRPKDFSSYQAKLQEEARLALGQAKEMARMQMHLEKQSRVKSPITEIVRGSFCKVGFPFPESKRRMSRQILTDMNVAQLQVIVNDFHTQIENLNEVLVELLLKRDDLHMEQDSMLVDIEDLTKHLGAKEQLKFLKAEGKNGTVNVRNKTLVASMSSKSSKLKSFVKK